MRLDCIPWMLLHLHLHLGPHLVHVDVCGLHGVLVLLGL
jgi:hypothetical protein